MSQAVDVVDDNRWGMVTARSRSGVCQVRVVGNGALFPANTRQTVGSVKAGHRPAADATSFIGLNGGSWLLLTVNTAGEVQIYQQYNSDSDKSIAHFDASVTFVEA